MPDAPDRVSLTDGRIKQKQRTRIALLDAAADLSRRGVSPSIGQIAEAANISPATAYRYFPNTQSLWNDVAIRRISADALTADLPDDIVERVEIVIRRIARMQFADEALWREALRAVQERWLAQQHVEVGERAPVRGTTRIEALTIALRPLQPTLGAAAFTRAVQALMFLCGVEALVVARDALGLEEEAAAEVMCWSARAIITTAIEESGP
jgi:AcrR family transcriptional regulator